jgi:hypothetical protein
MTYKTREARMIHVGRALLAGAVAVAVVVTGTLAGCSSSGGVGTASSPAASPSESGMSGMGMSAADPMYSGTGLSSSNGGFTFTPVESTALASGKPGALVFRILDASGMTVTAFEPDQTKLMHFYLIRSDLTGFQHVHPTMAANGTWSASLAALVPGSYRAYVAFNAKNALGTTVAEVLSRTLTVTVPGVSAPASTALPAPGSSTTVDGYTVTVSGEIMAAMEHTLTVSVSKGGKPVTDLQPYLETYAHLTAVHAGDLAFTHLHPEGAAAMMDTGGPTLTFQAMLPSGGDWRFFIQFQTGGALHTAAITLRVGG